MNFLAHFYLSDNDDELLLGNLLGDVVKGGVDRYAYPGTTPRIRQGIRLHRAIDTFTDQHPIVALGKARLRPRYGLLAGVIMDLYYDHVLARTWAQYASVPLGTFAEDVYQTLLRNRYRLPPGVHSLVEAMHRHDWLTHYAQPEGIGRALRGLAQRVPVAAGIATATDELRAQYPLFETEFHLFFAELRAHCRALLA
jgi:acyl carrier protein phosphodiesterase